MRRMKNKLFLLLAGIFVCCCVAAQDDSQKCRGMASSSADVCAADTTEVDTERHYAVERSDTAGYNLKMRTYNAEVFKVPRYDTFKENMKNEPLLVDFLRDIIGCFGK